MQVTGLSACLQALHGTSVILERQQRLIKEHMPLFSEIIICLLLLTCLRPLHT